MPSLIFKRISATVSIVNLKSLNTAIERVITSTEQIISLFLIYITPTGSYTMESSPLELNRFQRNYISDMTSGTLNLELIMYTSRWLRYSKYFKYLLSMLLDRT